MKEWLTKNWSNVIFVLLMLSILPIVRYISIYQGRQDDIKLKASGIIGTAKVTKIIKVKLGFYVQYAYKATDGEVYEQDELFHDLEEVYNQGIEIGNCYNIIYVENDPEVREVDFKKTVDCNEIETKAIPQAW